MSLKSLLALGLLAWPLASAAGGPIYRYEEADGTIVYTNVPPKKGRRARTVSTSGFRPAPAPAAAGRITTHTSRALTAFDDDIEAAAAKYKIPANLVRAIMHAESAFDPNAVSIVGASGLMQLMPATAREMYVKDIFEPKDNIEGGVRYLRVLANLFEGDMVKMVAGYNAGPDAVKKYGGKVPPYPETQQYVRKVLKLYFQYKTKSDLAADDSTR